MDKELPLARTEKERWTVLLARIGSGESGSESARRNQRAQDATTVRTSQSRAVKDIEAKSKSSRRTERFNARRVRPERYGQGNKNRKQDRRDEGEDSKPRWSAQELGIVWIGSYCPDGSPHYLIEYSKTSFGSLFKCVYCHKVKWLPTQMSDAFKLDAMMRKYGQQEGYCHFLNFHRDAKVMVAKFQELERIKNVVDNEIEFARIADKVLNEKEYDRKEVTV